MQNLLFVWLYDLGIRLFLLGIRIASIWNSKARSWVEGRKNLFETLASKINPADRIIWFHCASAGELEQGKPVIEALKQQFPSHKILVSFFSPSGYEVGKKYQQADIVTYLPADTRENAKRFIRLIRPELIVFIKYEYWYRHLSAAAFYHIPILLVSGIFRKEQVFFKWYGGFYRQLLFLFRHLFVQDAASLELLKQHQVHHASIGGDTRFDRVQKIASAFTELELIRQFSHHEKTIVAGSTWPDDEELLADYAKSASVKMIIAPHEVHESHLQGIESLFPHAVRYSVFASNPSLQARTLIIDNIGMLSRLYYYATVCYVGGGFNKSGIHNTLEAAVYGRPVIFGPHYQKFREARELIDCGGAFSIQNAAELKSRLDQLLFDQEFLQRSGEASKNYVQENTGATGKVWQFIQENRLFTR